MTLIHVNILIKVFLTKYSSIICASTSTGLSFKKAHHAQNPLWNKFTWNITWSGAGDAQRLSCYGYFARFWNQKLSLTTILPIISDMSHNMLSGTDLCFQL